MRLRIDFKTEKIPIIYRHRFIALIKEALKETDNIYKERLYPQEVSQSSKIRKPFCFSLYLPPQRVQKRETIMLDDDFALEETLYYLKGNRRISFFISSCDYEFMVNFYNGILNIERFRLFNDCWITRERIHLINERRINTRRVTFRTMSPILIEDKEDRPVLPDGSLQEFNHHFNSIHQRILKDIRGNGLKEELRFSPISIKKQVIKHTLRDFRLQTGKPIMMLTAFSGCFMLEGDPDDLQMLYQIGMGQRTGQGFGMVEVV